MAGSLTGGSVEDGVARTNDAYIAALLRERDGYIARGLGDRVSAVEAELVRVGIELDLSGFPQDEMMVERATVEPKAERAVTLGSGRSGAQRRTL